MSGYHRDGVARLHEDQSDGIDAMPCPTETASRGEIVAMLERMKHGVAFPEKCPHGIYGGYLRLCRECNAEAAEVAADAAQGRPLREER